MGPARIPTAGAAATAVLGLALALGACGGDSSPAPKPVNSAAAARDQELPASPKSTRLTKPGSPGAAVVRNFRYIQLGAIPASVALYSAGVRSSVGLPELAGGLQLAQGSLKESKATVERVEKSPGGTLVILRAQPPTGASQLYLFAMRRQRGQWVIAYDTLTANSIQSYATNAVQDGIKPGAKTPAPRAAKAGRRAASEFRLAPFR